MEQFSGKWVAIGTVIIVALNMLCQYTFAEPLAIALLPSAGLFGTILIVVLLISLLSFFVGGVIVARLSPGETVKEPGLASVFAVLLNLIIISIDTGSFEISWLAIMIGYGFGVAGGKVGEMWQTAAEA